jgi:class 3 adenylate cyclase
VPVCARCGSENREGARFCDSCGAALAEVPQTREVRKTVSVLFCDVSGSTALGERIDPESLRHVMARYFEVAKMVVERHGGTVEKFIGDAVMAVFGVPAVHEDDALRAVRAADDLRIGLADLNDELEQAYGTRLELRIGVNIGRSSPARASGSRPATPSTWRRGSSRRPTPEKWAEVGALGS